MINYIPSENLPEGIHALARTIQSSLEAKKKTLWLVSGGSNVPITMEVLREIRKNISAEALSNLTVSQTDERYGPVGHMDSNWKQLIDLGFDMSGITTLPVLAGLPLSETVEMWAEKISPVLDSSDTIIGQFGIGADGHIAGILPHTSAVGDTHVTSGYVATPFSRLTLTPQTLRRIQVAYVFAFGQSKQAPLEGLWKKNVSINDQPLHILHDIAKVYIYSDVVTTTPSS